MALIITAGQTANSTTGGTTLEITGVTASVGDMLVLGVAADNGGVAGASSFSSVSDSAGNSWVTRAATNYTPGGVANDGTTLIELTCLVTSALASGTITITFADSIAAKSAALWRAQPDAGEIIEVHSVGAGWTGTNTTPSTGTIADVPSGVTLFGFIAAESGGSATTDDSDTTNGTWSAGQMAQAATGTAATSQVLRGQHKTVSATGDQTYDPTLVASRDWAINWLIIQAVKPATLAATEAADILAAAASVDLDATLAATEAVDTLAASADVGWGGEVAATEPQDVASFSAAVSFDVELAANEPGDVTRFLVKAPDLGPVRSIRILAEITWPTAAVSRLWDGSGPFVAEDGEVWAGVTLTEGLDVIEQAINGEAFTLNISLTGVASDDADAVWLSYTNDQIIGATVKLLIQPCDGDDQPLGEPQVRFTGTIDNILFDDRVINDEGGERQQSTITVEVTNRFTLRRLTSGAVLSDTDQRARAAVLNLGGNADRFCERVPLMNDKTIVWPRWN